MVVMRTVVPTLVAASLAGGLVGGLIGAGVMSAAHAVMSKASRLADPGPKEDDATVKIADAVARRVRGHRIAEDAKPLVSNVVHYGFGAHAVVVPALGLARSPLRQPVSKEAVEFVLHLAYGIAWDSCGARRSESPYEHDADDEQRAADQSADARRVQLEAEQTEMVEHHGADELPGHDERGQRRGAERTRQHDDGDRVGCAEDAAEPRTPWRRDRARG